MKTSTRATATALVLAGVLGAGYAYHDGAVTVRSSAEPSPTAPAVPTTPDVPTESPPPRWVQPNETRAPETERPVPTAPTTAPRASVAPSPATVTPRPTAPATTPSRTSSPPPVRTTPVPSATTPPRTSQAPATRPPATAQTAAPRGNTVTIGSWTHGYVTAYGSQAAIDACKLVEWEAGWFAGHDWCGYAFWATLGKGREIVLTGPRAGTYRVTATVYLTVQGGRKPALPAYDIVLQTCQGSGTRLVLATKVG